jgi:NAD(P)-dependent dehydrogenase (short-subunit alcohol dehydrogenase family)
MAVKWSWENIPDLKGKIIIVTGGNSGLGFFSVEGLASRGAEVILASRSLSRGESARAKILRKHPEVKICVMALDLGSLDSVQAFAEQFSAGYQQLDVLINNAGIMMTPESKTKDGFESQLGTNHFGHFALTGLLWPILKKTEGSRIVNVASLAHKYFDIDFNNLQFEAKGTYKPGQAYSYSKLANLLFTFELQRKIEKEKLSMAALAAHPGVSRTNLLRGLFKNWWAWLLLPLYPIVFLFAMFAMQSAKQGALPQVRAAVDPEALGGQYYGPNSPNEYKGYPVLVDCSETAKNAESAKKLWETSEKLTGISFN